MPCTSSLAELSCALDWAVCALVELRLNLCPHLPTATFNAFPVAFLMTRLSAVLVANAFQLASSSRGTPVVVIHASSLGGMALPVLIGPFGCAASPLLARRASIAAATRESAPSLKAAAASLPIVGVERLRAAAAPVTAATPPFTSASAGPFASRIA